MLHVIDATHIGPHISEYTRSRTTLDVLTTWESNLGMLAKHAPFAYSLQLNVELWKICDYLPHNRQCKMMQVLHPLVL